MAQAFSFSKMEGSWSGLTTQPLRIRSKVAGLERRRSGLVRINNQAKTLSRLVSVFAFEVERLEDEKRRLTIVQSTHLDVKEYSYFAGNEWRKAPNNKVFDVHEPYSGKLFARVAAGSREDGRAAVDAAAKAFPSWAETTPAERARLFLKAAEIVKRRRAEIA
jgi:Aldehyde dehydrogenase family